MPACDYLPLTTALHCTALHCTVALATQGTRPSYLTLLPSNGEESAYVDAEFLSQQTWHGGSTRPSNRLSTPLPFQSLGGDPARVARASLLRSTLFASSEAPPGPKQKAV